MIAVSDVGGIKDGDIKQMIKDNKLLVEAEGIRVLESDNMYIKQAEHTLRTENFEAAGTYIMKALEQNPDSTVSLLKCTSLFLLAFLKQFSLDNFNLLFLKNFCRKYFFKFMPFTYLFY